MRDCIKGLIKIQKDRIHDLPIIHLVGDLIIEEAWITKVRLHIVESMLTMSYNSFILSMPLSNTQHNPLCNFFRA